MRIATALTVLPAMAMAASTDSFAYHDMCSIPDLELNGDASKSGLEVRLTENEKEETSTVFYQHRVDFSVGASVSFEINTGEDSLLDSIGNPDGFALVICSEHAVTGDGASGIGYNGLEKGLAVEVDFYQNTGYIQDPNDHHMAYTDSTGSLSAVTVDDQYVELGSDMIWIDVKTYQVTATLPEWPEDTSEDVTLHFTIDAKLRDGSTSETVALAITRTAAELQAIGLDNAYVGISGSTGDGDTADQWIKTFMVNTATGVCADNFKEVDGACEVDTSFAQCDPLDTCHICTSNAFCCGWSGDTCELVEVASGTDLTLAGSCSGTTVDDSGTDGVEVFLGVMVGILAVALVVSTVYWIRRFKTTTESVAMLGDMGAEYNSL
mmetsp:Transcript_30901/g.61247  ORF Transcript_30901/g.61247 Transcript_30901/m.61247 type:complete len:380 (+) Transcript_30901:10-1149(+)